MGIMATMIKDNEKTHAALQVSPISTVLVTANSQPTDSEAEKYFNILKLYLICRYPIYLAIEQRLADLEAEDPIGQLLTLNLFTELFRAEKIAEDLKMLGIDEPEKALKPDCLQSYLQDITNSSFNGFIAHMLTMFWGDLFGGQKFSEVALPYTRHSKYSPISSFQYALGKKKPGYFAGDIDKALNPYTKNETHKSEILAGSVKAFRHVHLLFDAMAAQLDLPKAEMQTTMQQAPVPPGTCPFRHMFTAGKVSTPEASAIGTRQHAHQYRQTTRTAVNYQKILAAVLILLLAVWASCQPQASSSFRPRFN